MAAAWLLAVPLLLAPAGAAQRGNTVLERDPARPVYSFAAVLRVPVLLGGGTGVIQPVGFGAGLQFRYHGLRIGRLRFGGEIVAGHSRILERQRLQIPTEDGGTREVVRYAALDQTSFALGPSFQLVAGPVIIEIGGGVGVGIGNFVRPLGPTKEQEEQTTEVSAVARADGHVGIPLRNNQGIVIGAHFEKFFSGERVVGDPELAMDPDAEANIAPFDMVIAPYLGYQAWF